MAVDMEFTSLMTIAFYRKVELVGIIVITNELSSENRFSGFNSPQVSISREKIARALASYYLEK